MFLARMVWVPKFYLVRHSCVCRLRCRGIEVDGHIAIRTCMTPALFSKVPGSSFIDNISSPGAAGIKQNCLSMTNIMRIGSTVDSKSCPSLLYLKPTQVIGSLVAIKNNQTAVRRFEA